MRMVIFQLKSFNFRLNKSDSNSKKTKDLQPGNISKAEGRMENADCRCDLELLCSITNSFFKGLDRWIPSMIIK